MQRTICPDCGCKYWRTTLKDGRICPSCGGTGNAEHKCSECPTLIPGSAYANMRKTCSHKCALAREARLAREKREERGLKRKARDARNRPAHNLPSTLRKCHDCGCPTTDYRCASCRATWRCKHGVEGLYDPTVHVRPSIIDTMPI